MKIKPLKSIVSRSQSAEDRRQAIQKSWSNLEAEKRSQIATETQLLLALMITVDREGTREASENQKRVEMGGSLEIGEIAEGMLPRFTWANPTSKRQCEREVRLV